MNKICKQCKVSKPLNAFSADKTSADGHQRKCKDCDRAYYLANKEKIAKRRAKYYQEHKEEHQQRCKDLWKRKGKIYSANQKEYKQKYNRSAKGIFIYYRRRAQQKELTFQLTVSDFEWCEKQKCHYCQVQLSQARFDRVDSNKGYTKDNIVPCCWECNQKKRAKSYNQFLEEMRQHR